MIPGEKMLSANKIRMYLAGIKGCKRIHHNSLMYAVREKGMPWHPDPFGEDRMVFYISEVDAWLANLGKEEIKSEPPKSGRRPGRPRKHT